VCVCVCTVCSIARFQPDAQDHKFLRGQVSRQGQRANATAARAFRQQQQGQQQDVAADTTPSTTRPLELITYLLTYLLTDRPTDWLTQRLSPLSLSPSVTSCYVKTLPYTRWHLRRFNIGTGDGGKSKGALVPPPSNLGEKVFFGQTSFNIRAVYILLKEGRTFVFWQYSVFHFTYAWNIALHFETRFSSTFYWFFTYIFGQKCLAPPKLTELLSLCVSN